MNRQWPGTYLDDPLLPLLTAAEARDAVGYMRLLETLDLTPRGQAAGRLAADLARRLPAD
ncbi:hypothetical protein AQF52_6821 [Streptomyces venezuelae]|uniref:hypothetical protein n=1 Tax=Streptomyces gardneri TaxID=66892 RepID=UPI0006BD7DAF|nr:hypothetical protein [Streptomyces gardneri]ALO12411.1 hypothetical protein AQF52_6821 [Streptomyces venezuelae]QPK49195.1 hypothetical protein H4W23_34255 [Streptomyces gardneri]WRK40700.1 hypothetical protein U0M97_34425 [Streptomyces venezuelae]CUM36981.1 hypothetical protein BN2537_2927 [Streptomyces venezuelae]